MWSLQVPEEDMNLVRPQEAAPKHDGRQHSVVRRGLIIPGDRSDGLERQGSNPWSTTKQYAPVVELVDTLLSKGRRKNLVVSSNLTRGTTDPNKYYYE